MSDTNKEEDFASLSDFADDTKDSSEPAFDVPSDDDDDGFDPAGFAGLVDGDDEDDDDDLSIQGISGPGEAAFSGGFDDDEEDDDEFDDDDPFAPTAADDGDDDDLDAGLSMETNAEFHQVEDDEGGEEFDNAHAFSDDAVPGDGDDGDFDPEDDEDEHINSLLNEADNENDPDAAPQKSLLSKLILPVGGAALAGIAGFGAWSMFMSGDTSQPQVPPAQQIAQPVTGFPTQLPTIGGNAPSAPATPAAPALPSPTPSVNPTLMANSGNAVETPRPTALPTFGTPAAGQAPLLAPPTRPAASANPTANLLPTVAPAAPTAPAATPAPVAPRAPAVSAAPSAPASILGIDMDRLDEIMAMDFEGNSAAIRRLSGRFARLETAIAELNARLDGFESVRPAMNVQSSVSAPVMPAYQPIEPSLKPTVIDGVVLTGYSPKSGTAWIKVAKEHLGVDDAPDGRLTVKKGEDVPGAGKFLTVRRYGGMSIMVTSSGLVLE